MCTRNVGCVGCQYYVVSSRIEVCVGFRKIVSGVCGVGGFLSGVGRF